MPKETKFNHFSPVFSNKYWADSSGAITVLKRELDGSIRKDRTGPKKWGGEGQLYPQEVEDEFSKIENSIAPLYRKLLSNEPLDKWERLAWSYWILCQYARTPTIQLELAGLEQEVIAKFDNTYKVPWAQVEKVLKTLSSHGLEFPKNKDLLSYIALRDWVILRPAQNEFFIKGDVPVVIKAPLVDNEAYVVYPMSPTHCFFATILESFPPRQRQGEMILKPRETEFYLQLVASKSEREIICLPEHCSERLLTLASEFLGSNHQNITFSDTPDW